MGCGQGTWVLPAGEGARGAVRKEHKQATRLRIIETASRRLKRDGIDGSGVATLMADAGLTNGAFYAHFASKDDLVATTVADQRESLFPRYRWRNSRPWRRTSGAQRLRAVLDGDREVGVGADLAAVGGAGRDHQARQPTTAELCTSYHWVC